MTTPQLDAKTMEVVAQIIYEQWSDREGWIEWTPGGNSARQDDARADAREILQVLVERGWQEVPPDHIVTPINAKCPFDDYTDLEPEQACPICGDLVTWDQVETPSRCIANRCAPGAPGE